MVAHSRARKCSAVPRQRRRCSISSGQRASVDSLPTRRCYLCDPFRYRSAFLSTIYAAVPLRVHLDQSARLNGPPPKQEGWRIFKGDSRGDPPLLRGIVIARGNSTSPFHAPPTSYRTIVSFLMGPHLAIGTELCFYTHTRNLLPPRLKRPQTALYGPRGARWHDSTTSPRPMRWARSAATIVAILPILGAWKPITTLG